MSVRWFHLFVVAALAWSFTFSARAQSPSAAELQKARELAHAGKELFDAGDHEGAIANFEAAEAIVHAPPHLLFIARSKAGLGQLLAARTIYRQLADEVLPKDAPGPFSRAQTEGRAELQQIASRIGTITIVTDSANVVVTVDGEVVTTGAIEVDPGAHVVEATADGRASFRRTVSVGEGETEIVELDMTVTTPPQEESTAGGLPVVPIVLVGLGAAGLIVGAVMGGIAATKVSDIRDRCPQNPCPAELADDKSSATSFATASTVSFIVGGILAAGGLSWLIVDLSTTSNDTAGYAAVRGTF